MRDVDRLRVDNIRGIKVPERVEIEGRWVYIVCDKCYDILQDDESTRVIHGATCTMCGRLIMARSVVNSVAFERAGGVPQAIPDYRGRDRARDESPYQ